MYLGFHSYSSTIVTVVNEWVQLWDPLLHKFGLSCHGVVTMVTKLNLDSPRLTGASSASTSEVWMSILEWLKLLD
jgi:hypothetical protein